jgi:undecaprenyl-diphosphatase
VVFGICVPLVLFAFLAAYAVAGPPAAWDRYLFGQLYSGESQWPLGPTPGQDSALLDATLPFVNAIGNSYSLGVLFCAIVATLLLLRLTRAAVFIAAAVAVTLAAPVLKAVFGRPSPFAYAESFPSGHGIASMAIAGGVFVLLAGTRLRWAAALGGACLVLAVGVAVVADGGHWPSDVLAGWCLSVAWVSGLTAVVTTKSTLGNRHWETDTRKSTAG